MAGRPTLYTQELADTICDRLCDGMSLREICRADDMPNRSSVFKWIREIDEFSNQYARAREVQADELVDDMLEIADDATNDWMQRNGEGDVGWAENGDHIQRTKLRIDTRKWIASKMKPKKYGDKVQNEHSGPDGKPIETVDKTDPTDIARRVAFLLSSGANKLE